MPVPEEAGLEDVVSPDATLLDPDILEELIWLDGLFVFLQAEMFRMKRNAQIRTNAFFMKIPSC